MQYQQNWTRPVRVTDPCEVSDYYDKYEQYEGVFDGSFHNVTVIYCYSTFRKFEDKNNQGAYTESETINLVCLREDNTYILVTIWGSKRTKINGEWSEWSNNPVQLQDFLFLAGMQKGHAEIAKKYEFSTSWETREVYPHICGTRLKLCVVQTGVRAGKNNQFYPIIKTAIFNFDGRSALEIEMDDNSKMNAKDTHKNFKKLYQDFVGDEVTKVAPPPAPAPEPEVKGVSGEEEEFPF